ncbi:MAG: hypothetical protein HS111_12405 [Kofleriaceae bacterium]|nr:hypothetical protein [Kofleriaceae bacterium]
MSSSGDLRSTERRHTAVQAAVADVGGEGEAAADRSMAEHVVRDERAFSGDSSAIRRPCSLADSDPVLGQAADVPGGLGVALGAAAEQCSSSRAAPAPPVAQLSMHSRLAIAPAAAGGRRPSAAT